MKTLDDIYYARFFFIFTKRFRKTCTIKETKIKCETCRSIVALTMIKFQMNSVH